VDPIDETQVLAGREEVRRCALVVNFADEYF
jgi:hypothetical protein